MQSDIDMNALAPRDDLSAQNDPVFAVYSDSLSSAFRHPQIRNLALSGSLGSGKSSIIRSFDRERNKTKHFLYISLIDFSRAVQGAEKKPYDQRQLEYSLLSQIQGYCTSDDLPDGSVGGIPEKFKFLKLSAGILALLFLSVFVLIFHEKFGALATMIGIPGYFRSIIHTLLYLFVGIVLCGCVYRILTHCLPFLQVSKLSLKSNVAEAEINLGKDRTALDTHKFELAYILERIGQKHDYTVVFEDLERLDPAITIDIMGKLRELNNLTNNHLEAQDRENFQPIRFVYAISDSILPAEYRTKFYDCIIPVVPVSHPLNSRTQLGIMLDELGFDAAWKGKLCDALSDAFVDYRSLLSLRNEFQVLLSLCRATSGMASQASSSVDSCNEAVLFAITAYKLLLPEWFERTLSTQGNGILPDFDSEEERIDITKYLMENHREKAIVAVRKLFDTGLLGKASMHLIVGEQALVEQWMKINLSALDRDTFDIDDTERITTITEALASILQNTVLDPKREPYSDFRKALSERLYTLTSEEQLPQFLLVASNLATVSRGDVLEDWAWGASWWPYTNEEFCGFLGNYLSWLADPSDFRKLKDNPNAIVCLKSLSEETPEHRAIALAHAKDLFKLSYHQGFPECADTVRRLKALCDAHPDHWEFALEYAKGLVRLSAKQNLSECTDAINRLKDLANAHPDHWVIALEYARGLFNLSNAQELSECADTVRRLKTLYDAHPDHWEFALEYSKGLANLSAMQQLPERIGTINRLKVLYDAHPDHLEFAFHYAKGLYNLSNAQELSERTGTINRLKVLYDAHPDRWEIALNYANGLYNLSCFQKGPQVHATILEIVKVLRGHPDAVPGFREGLDKLLPKVPGLRKLYQPLLELFEEFDRTSDPKT